MSTMLENNFKHLYNFSFWHWHFWRIQSPSLPSFILKNQNFPHFWYLVLLRIYFKQCVLTRILPKLCTLLRASHWRKWCPSVPHLWCWFYLMKMSHFFTIQLVLYSYYFSLATNKQEVGRYFKTIQISHSVSRISPRSMGMHWWF